EVVHGPPVALRGKRGAVLRFSRPTAARHAPMRAMRLVQFGDAPSFELLEVDDPEPGPDDVVVQVLTAALNRRDPWIWTMPEYCELPVTLGSDGAGVITTMGDGVTGLRLGD